MAGPPCKGQLPGLVLPNRPTAQEHPEGASVGCVSLECSAWRAPSPCGGPAPRAAPAGIPRQGCSRLRGFQSAAPMSHTHEPLWRACSHRRTRRHHVHPLGTRTAQDSLQDILTDVDPQKGAVPSLQQSRSPRPVHCALPASVQHSWHETAKAHSVQFQGFPSRESRPIRICELGVAKSQGLSGAARGHTAAAPVRVGGNAVVKGCELGWRAA